MKVIRVTDSSNALQKVVFNGNNYSKIITLYAHNEFRNKLVVYDYYFLVSAIIGGK